uniref:Uncharacterized protein n=1 Tax=Glossina pallidipes TaxID=7398 RepID=A0A1A9ZSF6_GLOPL
MIGHEHQFTQGTTYKGFEGSKPERFVINTLVTSSALFTQQFSPPNNRLATERPAFIATGVSLGRPFTTSPTAKIFVSSTDFGKRYCKNVTPREAMYSFTMVAISWSNVLRISARAITPAPTHNVLPGGLDKLNRSSLVMPYSKAPGILGYIPAEMGGVFYSIT